MGCDAAAAAVKIGISRGNDFIIQFHLLLEEKYQSLREHLLFLNYSPYIIFFIVFSFRFSLIYFLWPAQVQQQPNSIAGGAEDV